MCREHDWKLASRDVAQGLQIPGNDQAAEAGGGDPLAAIRAVNALATADSSAILVLANFHRFLQSAEVVQALAHPIRIAIADLLKDGEQCVCDIADSIGAERSNVSRDLSVMLKAGVLRTRT